jgi:hypothetical protein
MIALRHDSEFGFAPEHEFDVAPRRAENSDLQFRLEVEVAGPEVETESERARGFPVPRFLRAR